MFYKPDEEPRQGTFDDSECVISPEEEEDSPRNTKKSKNPRLKLALDTYDEIQARKLIEKDPLFDE